MKEREQIERAVKDLMEDNVKLSAEQEAWLDEKLDAQSQIAQMVRALPNEEPALAWRNTECLRRLAFIAERR